MECVEFLRLGEFDLSHSPPIRISPAFSSRPLELKAFSFLRREVKSRTNAVNLSIKTLDERKQLIFGQMNAQVVHQFDHEAVREVTIEAVNV